MYTDGDLYTEICETIDGRLVARQPVPAAWVTQEVLHRHPGLDGSDSEFYRLCAQSHVRNEVRRALRRFKPQESEDVDPQLALPGFERLQKAYLVERKGEHQVLPIESMTDAEIEAKAVEYERISKGCQLHARELRRYAKKRRRAA